MKLTSSAQMRELDRYAIEDMGIKGAALMSKAAEHVAAAAFENMPLGGCAAVFCGTGNNGGDGIGAAARLIEKGVPVRVFIVGSEARLTADSREMLRQLTALGGVLDKFTQNAEIEDYVKNCNVLIDAMFGIGLNSDLRGDALSAAELINNSRACVIAADIASGVHADTGRILGYAVKADITVTFSAPKPGHFVEPGGVYCGELRVRDIGIPKELLDDCVSKTFAVMPEDISLPRRKPDSHKGDYGRCLIIGGSVGYTGAPVLAARAASRTGAGLVFIGVPETIYNITAVKCDEEMPFPLPCDENGILLWSHSADNCVRKDMLALNAAGEILRRAEECDAVLIGPGLGRSEAVSEIVCSLIKLSKKPVILDADGINAIAGNIDVLDEAACPLILTPHDGEFLRLGGDLLHSDRLGAATEFAKRHRCVLVLKGHRTITALPDGSAYINTTGGPAMAKGGSGDVLAGMITALIGQGFPVKDAILSAVCLHGLSGDFCAEKYGEYSVTASDIIDTLPKALRKIVL